MSDLVSSFKKEDRVSVLPLRLNSNVESLSSILSPPGRGEAELNRAVETAGKPRGPRVSKALLGKNDCLIIYRET
jgi:hypothetical protein